MATENPSSGRGDGEHAAPTTGGRLVVVATPIGNLADLSPRAVQTLREADLVAAEDTRRSGRLLAAVGLRKQLISYHEHNERSRTDDLLDRVAGGQIVALVTDAGTPGLADPGFVLVREAVERGLAVEAVPGPAAAVHALVLSGLPMERFVFEGFLPRKAAARDARLAELATERRTLVFYVAPHRAGEELDALAGAFGGDRRAAVGRELTKLHEEVIRGPLSDLAKRAQEGYRGELTVVVEGSGDVEAEPADDELVRRVRALLATGVDRKTAMRDVARATGVPRRRVYQALLDAGAD